MATRIWVVRVKKEYAGRDDLKWRQPEYFKNESRANSVRDDKNLGHGMRITEELRSLKWGRKSSPHFVKAQKIREEAIQGVWEVISHYCDDQY
tara:strand:+ start:9253 stop:9531 length:279 start_codon:yes stop_codon:yes gene_type:complete